MTIQSYSYNQATPELRKEIAELLNIVWPDSNAQSNAQSDGQIELQTSHPAELMAQSFCCYLHNKLIGYGGVVQKEISHCGKKFRIAGLSCVSTHPDYRGRGVGGEIVRTATEFIQSHKEFDIGIFTCQPDLAAFYKEAGDWNVCADVTLIGSHDPKALSSDSLNVVVLLRLFSEKAQSNKNLLFSEPISLDFPVGEFI